MSATCRTPRQAHTNVRLGKAHICFPEQILHNFLQECMTMDVDRTDFERTGRALIGISSGRKHSPSRGLANP